MPDGPVLLADLLRGIAVAALKVPARTLVAQPALPGVAPHALAVAAARLQVTLDVETTAERGFVFSARRRRGIASRLRIATALLPSPGAVRSHGAAPAFRVARPRWWLPADREGRVGIALPDGGVLRALVLDGEVAGWVWPDGRAVSDIVDDGVPLAPLVGLMRRMAEEPALSAAGVEDAPLPRHGAAPEGVERMLAVCRQLAGEWVEARRAVAALGPPAGDRGAVVLGGYGLAALQARLEQPLDAALRPAEPDADPDEVVSLGVSFELPDQASEPPLARLMLSPPDALAGGAVHEAFALALREAATAIGATVPGAAARLRDAPDAVMRIRHAEDEAGWDSTLILCRPSLLFLVDAQVAPGPVVALRPGSAMPLGLDPAALSRAEIRAWRRVATVLGRHVAALAAWTGGAR